MKKVLILMSTYNGERFLRPQLDSLFTQKGINITLLVRDDGSSDSTIEILKKYGISQRNIEIIQGENIGASKSFFEVAHYAQSKLLTFDYYAFCDQDDVWLPDKLKSAVDMLEKEQSNKLYFCRANYVDSNLHYIGPAPITKYFDYTTSVYQNPALGCTMVFDRTLFDHFCLAYPEIDNINNLHDAWMFKCALFTGSHVISDDNIHIQYRQHGNNVTFASKSKIEKYKNALYRKFERKNFYKHNTEIFLSIYENLINGQEKVEFLKSLVSYDSSITNTFKFLQKQSWRTENNVDKILWSLLVLFRLF